ncbi:unnamed protein product [Bursaphelenchus xylophilus]|uniref:(pine wood nematode) hypothetical protein n=1 Tax=Bursaphelenchus xylophilus TaxID=6326 RepID=A0A1I7S4A1_BURXY|nr:unnamed protein product [Bursaphelenchus xylophilus]CAG9116878.1 unnamed protein product [Bursaphelenchus xylophilus]
MLRRLVYAWLALVGLAGILEDREVVCSSDKIVVNLSFARPFKGVVFAKDRYLDNECRWLGNGGHYLLVTVPLNYKNSTNKGEGFCGLQFNAKTGEHSISLIISPDPVILTDESVALLTHCVQTMEDFVITLEPPKNEGAFKVARNEAMTVTGNAEKTPSLSLRVLGDHGYKGDVITEGFVGQRITLDARLEESSIFDMFVHDCVAHDGTNNADATVPIIDANGCAVKLLRAIDPPVFSSSPMKNMAKHTYIHLYGFQFTSADTVHFECKITTCLNECPMKQCPDEGLSTVTSVGQKLKTSTVKTLLQMNPQSSHSHSQAMEMNDKKECLEPSTAAFVCLGTVVVFFLLAYFTKKLIRSYNQFVTEKR